MILPQEQACRQFDDHVSQDYDGSASKEGYGPGTSDLQNIMSQL